MHRISSVTIFIGLLLIAQLPVHAEAADAETITADTPRACNLDALVVQPATPSNQVEYIYCLFLRRAADPDGLSAYTALLTQKTLTIDGLMDAAFKSAEFNSDYNVEQLTPSAFVTLLYNVFLFRQPEPDALANYTSQLQKGELSELELFNICINSPEFKSKNGILFLGWDYLPRVVIAPGTLMNAQDCQAGMAAACGLFAAGGSSIDEFLDNPEQWADLRAYTGRLLYADWEFGYASDAQLSDWAAKMKKLNLIFEMSSGVLKPWSTNGVNSFQIDSKQWDRIIKAGGVIDAIDMDEPFGYALRSAKTRMSQADAVTQVADYVSLVHQNYPNIKVGMDNAYPSFTVEETIGLIQALQTELSVRGTRGLDFYRMDTNWIAFELNAQPGSWQEMSQIQQYCDSIGLPFGLIYWASNYPYDVREDKNIDPDQFWYNGLLYNGPPLMDGNVMLQGIGEGPGYESTGSRADQFVIANWVDAPSQVLPDNNSLSFTGSSLTLLKHYYGSPD